MVVEKATLIDGSTVEYVLADDPPAGIEKETYFAPASRTNRRSSNRIAVRLRRRTPGARERACLRDPCEILSALAQLHEEGDFQF